jgi:hypothetical protein
MTQTMVPPSEDLVEGGRVLLGIYLDEEPPSTLGP